jgi:hypothetical protein
MNHAAAILSLAAFLGQGTSTQAAQAPQLPRVYVHTEPSGEPSELRDRQQSVKDLRSALTAKKKNLVVVDDEERADLDVEILGRTTSVPKVRIGLAPPGGGPARVVRLRLKLTRGDESVELTNKNTPIEANRGWQSAAEDLAKQIDTWILEHKRRGPVSNTPRRRP